MKIGVCTELSNIKKAEKAGCEYIEANFTTCACMTEDEFAIARATTEGRNIPIYAMNCLIPGYYRLTGKEASLNGVEEYMEKGMFRANQLGVQYVVFGSGDARCVPKAFNINTAYRQLSKFLKSIAIIAQKYGIKIAIEPLCTKECNIISSITEGIKLAKMTAQPNVGVLADLYHMFQEGENINQILNAKGMLMHCHIAYPLKRTFPKKYDGYDYSDFFCALKKIHYNGGVSIEASSDDFENELKEAINILKEYL